MSILQTLCPWDMRFINPKISSLWLLDSTLPLTRAVIQSFVDNGAFKSNVPAFAETPCKVKTGYAGSIENYLEMTRFPQSAMWLNPSLGISFLSDVSYQPHKEDMRPEHPLITSIFIADNTLLQTKVVYVIIKVATVIHLLRPTFPFYSHKERKTALSLSHSCL